jgi:type IV secretory pathway VirD2 relaxase
MTGADDDFTVRPGKSRDSGQRTGGRSQRLASQVRRAAAKAGFTRRAASAARGTGRRGRGRIARLQLRSDPTRRRVVVKARVVRHGGARFRAAPLARHVAYLRRDGVTRDGENAQLFDADADRADGEHFSARCADDRHHFRFIVSPEDAGEMGNLRDYTRDLMRDIAQDLGTRLDWIAVDHWNTDNPHIHILLRGSDDKGEDLVIDRDYVREGLRARAEDLATIELGPRSEREIQSALDREIDAERVTSLDRTLRRLADDGVVDLRPTSDADAAMQRRLLGRMATLERLGLAEPVGPGQWSLGDEAEQTLHDLSIRTDIIKTMHRAMLGEGRTCDPERFALHAAPPPEPVIGRLVSRGLHDELAGSAYAVIDGADGHLHHLTFSDMDRTGDAPPGAIVELRSWRDQSGRHQSALATRSDLSIEAQISAPGATWLDRQLIAQVPVATGPGFGREVRDAMSSRARHLEHLGLAAREGGRVVPLPGLIERLRTGEIETASAAIAARTGLHRHRVEVGEHVSGIYRERVTLASGRFAMIDDGLGFQLVPWRPALDAQLGRHVTGMMGPTGQVDWSFGRGRGLGR